MTVYITCLLWATFALRITCEPMHAPFIWLCVCVWVSVSLRSTSNNHLLMRFNSRSKQTKQPKRRRINYNTHPNQITEFLCIRIESNTDAQRTNQTEGDEKKRKRKRWECFVLCTSHLKHLVHFDNVAVLPRTSTIVKPIPMQIKKSNFMTFFLLLSSQRTYSNMLRNLGNTLTTHSPNATKLLDTCVCALFGFFIHLLSLSPFVCLSPLIRFR